MRFPVPIWGIPDSQINQRTRESFQQYVGQYIALLEESKRVGMLPPKLAMRRLQSSIASLRKSSAAPQVLMPVLKRLRTT
jgi:hypothetical protein